jgi:hypothetical protein
MKQIHLDMGIENRFKLGKRHECLIKVLSVNDSINIFGDSVVIKN